MKKLLLSLFALTFSLAIFGQQNLYSDTKVQVQFTVEQFTDAVNDNFFEYYSFEMTNISQQDVSFTPDFIYVTETGDQRSSTTHDENNVIHLAPGETVKGDISDHDNLTLFKQFLVGNSGKKAANSTITVQSVSINYQ
ncbi:hypothetical protein [Brumimicrobium oceani]|uniref:Uncharacterized protein n=1 Tax=Brumimicrobium oceani TaxID=2100725 RepID=A0A2U2X0X2_9FLAO|nr:hypothetical protein [Brumimicrobium oceani]PWH81437.1 hypothetical protein DIT68_14990 [Brumimicrobium oceani]